MTFPYAGSFSIAGVGVNAAAVTAWDVSRFGSPPALNDAPPVGAPDASATTGPTSGFDGAYVVDLPTTDEYYVLVTYSGVRYWQGPVAGAGAGGGGGGGLPLVEVDTTTTQCGAELSWGSFSTGIAPVSFTFTVPPSGQVRAIVSAAGYFSTNDDTGDGGLWMTLNDGAGFGGAQVAPIEILATHRPSAADTSPTTTLVGGRWTYDSGVIGELTPGDVLTWHLVGGVLANTFQSIWRCSDGSSSAVPWGPTTARVFAA